MRLPSYSASVILIAVVSCCLPIRATAVSATPEEVSACREWAQHMFGASPQQGRVSSLKVIYQDTPDIIMRGRSWRGTPYAIADKTFSHGIAFNSTKHILVQLSQPGERFLASAGLENNDDTQRGATLGNGSVTFHVLVDGKEVFTSQVRRLKDAALPIDIPLKGATEFEIRVKDGGDGRGWDQAVWAEARVVLQNGETVRLQDLLRADAFGQNQQPFSFVYNGAPSGTLLGKWVREARERALDGARSGRDIIWRDGATGLEVHVEATVFRDFPAVEWVINFKNTGQADTPILQSIQALESVMPLVNPARGVLHWAKGAVASFDDFAPQETAFKAGTKLRLQPGGGRSSSQVLPFFNLADSDSGIVVGLGWSGEWAAEFAAESGGQINLKAGMARTHLVLHPGESIRTPRVLLLFYQGDSQRGQNLLRQFILAHHRPTPAGKPMIAPITCGNWGGTRAEIHLDNIAQMNEHKLPVEYYWIDAEWYGRSGAGGGWPINVGNWAVKKDLYPNGFKPISDALRSSNRELLLWFEPERVFRGTPWHQEHPDWLLNIGVENSLFNLGNPAARKFLTEFISEKIKEFGLGCYRQDFNIDPLPFWQAADAPNRQGITEIRYIEGLYAFWDGLLERHPGLIIDNCASGGRRIDIETVGRATPFWRTDGPRDAIAHQCHTYGLMSWVPLHSTSQDRAGDDYEFRSSMSSGLCLNWWVSGDVPAAKIRSDFPWTWAKKTVDQYVAYRRLFYGDYYPLTGYSQAQDLWMAYQFHRADLGEGLVVALKRPKSPYQTARFRLQGLEESAQYELTNPDTNESKTYPGKELLNEGVEVTLKRMPDSGLLLYKKK